MEKRSLPLYLMFALNHLLSVFGQATVHNIFFPDLQKRKKKKKVFYFDWINIASCEAGL